MKHKPSLTQIRTLLKEVVFNPRKTGKMSIISEVDSCEYYELRAIEEIHAARSIRIDITPETDEYHQHIITAIRLLLLARTSV